MADFENLKRVFGNLNRDLSMLESHLAEGETDIVYLKVDGSIRFAKGTRCPALIPSYGKPKGVKEPPPHVLCYWDLEKDGWRCLLRDRLIGFLEK